jgi:hypothetical protein
MRATYLKIAEVMVDLTLIGTMIPTVVNVTLYRLREN